MANTSTTVHSVGGYESVAYTVPAGATSQAAALALTPAVKATQLPGVVNGAINFVNPTTAATGLVLPVTPTPGVVITVINTNVTNAMLVWPPVGGRVAAAGTAGVVNAAATLALSGIAVFVSCGVQANGAGVPGTDFVRIV